MKNEEEPCACKKVFNAVDGRWWYRCITEKTSFEKSDFIIIDPLEIDTFLLSEDENVCYVYMKSGVKFQLIPPSFFELRRFVFQGYEGD